MLALKIHAVLSFSVAMINTIIKSNLVKKGYNPSASEARA